MWSVACGPAVETEEGGTTQSSDSTGVDSPAAPTMTEPSTSPVDGMGSSGETGADATTGTSSLDGEFFLAITATPVAPTTPFQFLAEVKVDAGAVAMLLTPLSLEIASVDAPREPVPPPFEVSGSISTDGSFGIEIPELSLPGPTNPITGSDIIASVTLEGVISNDQICGRVSGMITSPASIDLTGSTLAGVRMDGGPLPLPEDLGCAP